VKEKARNEERETNIDENEKDLLTLSGNHMHAASIGLLLA
jgi:hypothetical protein